MKKTYLKDYSAPKFTTLSDWAVDYDLVLETVWFWGLFTTQKTIKFRIYAHDNAKAYFDNWDNLIRNKKALETTKEIL